MAGIFNIEKESEEVFEFVCGPCYTDGEVLQAKGYCSNCQDYLCDTCLKHHLRPKPMRHHLLLDENEMPKDKKTTSTKASDICNERCLKHPGNIIEYYCKSHDYLGCTKCFISDNHRMCKGVVCIEDATAGLYESPEYKTYEGKIEQIANGLSTTSSFQQEKNENIKMYSVRAKSEIQKFRSSINVFLDTMEIELDQQVSQMKESQTSKWMTTSKQIEKLDNIIKTIISTKEQTKISGQRCNSYINMKRNVQQLKQHEDCMEKIKKESKVSEYIFKPDENLQKVIKDTKTLGKLVTYKEGSSGYGGYSDYGGYGGAGGVYGDAGGVYGDSGGVYGGAGGVYGDAGGVYGGAGGVYGDAGGVYGGAGGGYGGGSYNGYDGYGGGRGGGRGGRGGGQQGNGNKINQSWWGNDY